MSVLISFDAADSGLLANFVEDGFVLTTEIATAFGLTDAFWSGQAITDLGVGGYLLNNYSADTVVVRDAAGKTFGAVSVDVNGFGFVGFDGAVARTGSSPVRFDFTGAKAGGGTVTYSFTTDALDAFQTVALPSTFSAGLVSLKWKPSTGTAWGSFDNIVLTPNGAPVAANVTGSTTEDAVFRGALSATDPDGQALTYHAVGALPAGVVVNGDGTFSVAPLASDQALRLGQSREVTFQYAANDGAEDSAASAVTVTIHGANDAPTAAADRAATLENGPAVVLNVLANDSDPDAGDARTLVSVATAGALGAVSWTADGDVTYDPSGKFEGLGEGDQVADTFSYTTRDAAGATSTATVTIILTGSNDAPQAIADAATLFENQSVSIDVLANDTDVDAGDLRAILDFSQSTLGATVTMEEGKLVYHADVDSFDALSSGQSLADSFTYVITDAWGETSTATVNITVKGAANAPDIRGGNKSQDLVGTSGDERIFGGNSGDTLQGQEGSDTLDGGNGADGLWGGDGRDKLLGENGNDYMEAGAGDDTLDGGNGADTLSGGGGDDILTGGGGPDVFVFGENFGVDVIKDFDARNETIQMSPTMWGNHTDLLGAAEQIGKDVVITYDEHNSLTLLNVKLSSLGLEDFLFS